MELDDKRRQALDDLLAREEISHVLRRYSRGIDRHDESVAVSAYHTDARDEHGLPQDVVAHATAAHDGLWDAHQHFLTNFTIDIDGDTAHVESYFIATGRRKHNTATDFHCGRYVDRFEKRDGRWAITDRIRIYESGYPAEQAVEAMKMFQLGRQDASDLSFMRPLRVKPKSHA